MTKTDKQRDDFENHFLRCPYEWDFTRLGDESPWAGDYRDTAVCFAWDAWQAAIEHDRNQPAVAIDLSHSITGEKE